LKLEPLNIREILEEIISNYRYFVEQKSIRLQVNIDNISARLNRVYITQIFDNLLSNAVKFTPERKAIQIELVEQNGMIVFCVCDEGPGIEEAKLHAIFDRYSRQTTMAEQHLEQEGLGLAIVYRYTVAMKGTVRCESGPGKGTRIFVELPV